MSGFERGVCFMPPKKSSSGNPVSFLGDAFFIIEGMREKYQGPRRRNVYALVGRLCRRLGFEPVVCAVDSLKRRLKEGELEDPLRYLAGAAEKIARELTEGSGLPTSVPVTEARDAGWVESWYEAERVEGERRRQAVAREAAALQDLLEMNPEDPLLRALVEARRPHALRRLSEVKKREFLGGLGRAESDL